MKRLGAFIQAFVKNAEQAVTPEMKRALCEDAKLVIAGVLTGPWAVVATTLVNDLEKTIKDEPKAA